MAKKIITSLDYRRLADELWEKARLEEQAGLYSLADILKDASDNLHDIARKKHEEEEKLKKLD